MAGSKRRKTSKLVAQSQKLEELLLEYMVKTIEDGKEKLEVSPSAIRNAISWLKDNQELLYDDLADPESLSAKLNELRKAANESNQYETN